MQLLEDLLFWIFIFILGLVGLGVIAFPFWIIYAVIGLKRKCPRCKKWYAKERTYRELVGRKEWIGTEEQEREIDYGWGNPKGRVMVPVPVMKVRSDYRHDYRCRKCNHTWSKIESESDSYRL